MSPDRVRVTVGVRADLADLDPVLAMAVREWREDAWPGDPSDPRPPEARGALTPAATLGPGSCSTLVLQGRFAPARAEGAARPRGRDVRLCPPLRHPGSRMSCGSVTAPHCQAGLESHGGQLEV
jgi:hypothetical protein